MLHFFARGYGIYINRITFFKSTNVLVALLLDMYHLIIVLREFHLALTDKYFQVAVSQQSLHYNLLHLEE